VDIQVNGYGGQEFSSAELTPERVREIVCHYDAFGVVRCCPTLTTESLDVLRHSLRAIAAACESWPEVARRVAGVHLEGPYITPEDGARGAHPFEHCREPNWDEFQRLQEASGGRIRIHTMSPEFDGSSAYIRQVAQSGVVVAIGHTSARPSQIRRAADAGARLSTHLGNGSHARVHRHRNYIWAQLADDRLMASLIVDGHHLPLDVVKTFVRTKTPDRCILTSDLSGQAGQPPGRYQSDFCDVEILPEGRLVVAGQRELLAGAALPVGPAIPNVMHYAGVELAEAVRMAVHNPAWLLSIELGELEPGSGADLVQFRLAQPADGAQPARFRLIATVIHGDVVSGTLWQPGAGQPRTGTDAGATGVCPTTPVRRPSHGSRGKTGRPAPLSRGGADHCRPPQAG
jgi:N-acetylglucosamine-6-phosphate deacetylase